MTSIVAVVPSCALTVLLFHHLKLLQIHKPPQIMINNALYEGSSIACGTSDIGEEV